MAKKIEVSVELDYQVTQSTEFEFILHAARTPCQTVLREELAVYPEIPLKLEMSSFFPNQHIRLHAEPGPLRLKYAASMSLNHHLIPRSQLKEVSIAELPLDVLHYVHPSRYCPSDRFYQLAVQHFGALSPGYSRVQAVADWVRDRTCFQVGASNSLNCALDTLRSGTGVCRDFAHLMISICRALNIPARYATSIDYGADPVLGPTDFHAYVEVYLSGRWYIFDPTGISITSGLVRFATGRDANDVAFATLFGSALWTVPKVTITAIDCDLGGNVKPFPGDLAVSTDGPPDSQVELRARQYLKAA
jgi:transglutaminase-like putative cysteine protease